MRLADLIKLALENVRRNRTRSVLTLVGVMIGVAALFALLGYGAGLQQNAQAEYDRLELHNTLRVTSSPSPLDATGQMVYAEDNDWLDTLPAVTITDEVVRRIGSLPGVFAAYPEVVFPVEVKANGREAVATAEAVPMRFEALDAYRPAHGTFFASSQDSALVIAPAMARRLGYDDPADAVGDVVTITTASLDLAALRIMARSVGFGMGGLPIRKHRHQLRIAGVLDDEGQTMSGFVRVLVPLDLARSLEKVTFFSTVDLLLRRGDPGGYAAVRVQLEADDDYRRVRAAIEEEGLFVTGFRDQFQQVERLFLILDMALGIIGFIALLVAVIGIANTMMMNVLERTHEIGVMKALGGDEADLQRLFMVESVALGLVGSALGLVFGGLVMRLVNFGVNAYLDGLGIPFLDLFHTPVWMAVGVVALTAGISLLAGVLPARRAAQVEPITALRAG